MLRQLDATSLLASFLIDRNASSCLTPARNKQVEALAAQFSALRVFSEEVSGQLRELYALSRQRKYVTALFSGNGA